MNGNLTDEVDFETLVFKARIGEDLLYFSDSTSVFSLILNGYDSEYSIFKIENASPDDFDFTNDFRNTCSVRNSKFGANTPISDDLPF